MEDHATKLSQRIDRDTRQLIGDLQMQIIVLRAALDEMGGYRMEQESQHKTNGARVDQ